MLGILGELLSVCVYIYTQALCEKITTQQANTYAEVQQDVGGEGAGVGGGEGESQLLVLLFSFLFFFCF